MDKSNIAQERSTLPGSAVVDANTAWKSGIKNEDKNDDVSIHGFCLFSLQVITTGSLLEFHKHFRPVIPYVGHWKIVVG